MGIKTKVTGPRFSPDNFSKNPKKYETIFPKYLRFWLINPSLTTFLTLFFLNKRNFLKLHKKLPMKAHFVTDNCNLLI